MNGLQRFNLNLFRSASLAGTALLIGACAADAVRNPDVLRVRADYSALESDRTLASLAPVAMDEAEQALIQAEIPVDDDALSDHRVYVADRKVQTARALAEMEAKVNQREALSEQTEAARLAARTREADGANLRNEALMAELADLKAKETERGVQVTLGDVLFSTGQSNLKAGSVADLDRLAVALAQVGDRRVSIEGHTDSQGGDDMNLALSQRRADTVSDYLSSQGVASSRISASGKGEALPVADNDTSAGRQLNRRVEITIENPTP